MEYEKILFPRLLLSFIWTLVLHVFPLSLFVIVTNFEIVHPFKWLLNSTLTVFSIRTWIYLIPLHLLVFALGYVLSQELRKPPLFVTSKFKLVCSLFSKNNIIKWFLYIIIGMILPWSYLKLNNLELTQECHDSSKSLCLNETSVFLVSCGVWTAFYYFFKFDIFTEKHLQFPIIRQLRFLQIRSKFPNTFKNCLKLSLIPVFYFLLFYLWYGRKVASLFELILAAPLENSYLTRISGLLSASVLIKTWLISSVYLAVIETLQLMIQIFFTEHYSFDLIMQPNSTSVLLSNALGEKNVPIIQHLACYDLYYISLSQKATRWQVFTLSQPGGHPHTWNAILHESLHLIDKFISEIQEIQKVPEPEKPKSPVPKHYHVRDMTVRHEEIISGSVPLPQGNKIRNLIEIPQMSLAKQPQQSTLDEIWMKVESYMTVIQQNVVVNYIFGSKPDAKIRFLMSNSQPLIWVIQSISELSANALMEDQFGIVLKDLPIIINTLIRLKFALDKLGNLQKKFQKRDHDLCMKASLKSALRRSLYRIAIAYSDYLTDLPLPQKNLECMKNFVNFKEC